MTECGTGNTGSIPDLDELFVFVTTYASDLESVTALPVGKKNFPPLNKLSGE